MKNALILLSISLVFVTSLNIFYLNQHKKNRQLIIKQTILLSDRVRYLERSLNYRTLLNDNIFPKIKNKNIVIYASGEVCPSCVEKLLFLINDKYGMKDNSLFLTGYNSKIEFIKSFNDANKLDYDYLLDTSKFLEPVDNILVFKIEEERIKIILEYKPEEEFIFEEYFKEWNIE